MAGASSSSTELVAGFRIQRRLGQDVWEAVQPELGRRVALRRLAPGTPFDASRWPERAGVVGLYAVVDRPDGTYVATRFVPGARTLAEARASARSRRRWLDAVAAVLDGAEHGDLTARDVLIDGEGRAWVTGFGRPRTGDDGEGLERLRRGGRRARTVLIAAGFAVVALATTALLVVGGGGGEAAPSGNALPCTVMQMSLPGRPLEAPFGGLVHGWAVRGARGRLSLQVLTRTDSGYAVYSRTRFVTVADSGRPQYFKADASVPNGARFALEVAPDGAVGVRRRSGAGTARFFSPLRSERREPDTSGGAGEELLLRVDLVPRG
jgi:hypothetical protein